jgi:hypothetical protein
LVRWLVRALLAEAPVHEARSTTALARINVRMLPAVLFQLAIQSCLADAKQAGGFELVVVDDF